MYGNFIKESTATTGTGTMTLSAITGFERFSDNFSTNDLVYYCVQDGNNREIGIGTIGASNTLARTNVYETLVSGTRTVSTTGAATAITLSGGATVYCDVVRPFMVNPYGRTIASAATVDLFAAPNAGDFIEITGTTTITSFGFSAGGKVRYVKFAGALTLTNNANIVLPGGANITTAAGDFCTVLSYNATTTYVTNYVKASGAALVAALPLAGGTMAGAIGMNNNNLTGAKQVCFNGIVDDGSSSTSKTIDFTTGLYHKVLMSANCTFTFTAPTGPCVCHLEVTQDAVTPRTWTLPSGKWEAVRTSTDKALTATASALDILIARWNGSYWVFSLMKGCA